MITYTANTTNGRLENVIDEIRLLISWAESDAQHARENDAYETARDDEMRAFLLRQAMTLLGECRR